MTKNKDWISLYLDYTKRTEPPDSYRLWTAISTIAGALERKVWFEWDEKIYPNFYIVLVGPPAARKGTAMGKGEGLLRELKGEVKIAPNSSTYADLVHTMAKGKKKFQEPEGKIITHNSMTAHSRELTSLLNKDNLQMIPFLIEAYDCKFYEKGTRTMGRDVVENPFFNWIAATQPGTLRDGLPRLAIDQGLTSRMIFVVEHGMKQKILDPRPNATERTLHDRLLRRLGEINQFVGAVDPSPEFLELYFDWYEKLDMNASHDPAIQKYLTRKSTHLRKLCIALSASRDDKLTLLPSDFEKAKMILDRTERRMSYAFDGVGGSASWRSDLMAEVMANLDVEKELSFGDLYSRVYKTCTEKELLGILNDLTRVGKVEIEGLKRVGGVSNVSKSKTIIRWKEKE